MLNAAVPAYLGHDFKDASPGMRFGAYLRLWDTGWSKPKAGKVDAVRETTRLMPGDIRRMQALHLRQSTIARPLAAEGSLLTLDAVSIAPFTTGLGNEHPLENGFAFLNPYGLPYLPGSGVKGVLRQAARELQSGQWGTTNGWTEDAITFLFGLQSEDGDKTHQRGALGFWDVLPQLKNDCLQVEVMTPHQSHYYQKNQNAKSGDSTNPHDSGQPNPIHFLTVPPGSGFAFHVQCDVPYLARLAPVLAERGHWKDLVQAAFEHAFAWLGFGAKTAVGYGAMREDERARLLRQEQLAAQAERERAAAEAAELAAMSPEDAALRVAQPIVEAFRSDIAKAKAAGAYKPGQSFDQTRQAFIKTVTEWTESRSRAAAALALEESASKSWGRPSNKDSWAKMQSVIAALRGQA